MVNNVTTEKEALKTSAVTAGEPSSSTSVDPEIALSPTAQAELFDSLKKDEKKSSQDAAASPAAAKTPEEAPAQQASAKTRAPEHAKEEHHHKRDKHKGRYTTGEKIYDQVQFWGVKGLILAATALIAYQAKFGKDTNWIRKTQLFFKEWVQEPAGRFGGKVGSKIAEGAAAGSFRQKLGNKAAEVIGVFGAAFASTMILFHGGNVVSPVVKYFENHRKDMIHKWNQKWGKPGDTEIADEKFKDLPKQTWGDVVKGRLAAWMIVFGSFVTAFIAVGKVKGTEMYKFSWYEEWFARLTSGLRSAKSKLHIDGVHIKDVPITQELHELQRNHPEKFLDNKKQMAWYKTMHIIAMDFYATSMGIIVWNVISRFSAKMREHGGTFYGGLKKRVKEIAHGHFRQEEASDAPVSAATEAAKPERAEPAKAAASATAKEETAETPAPKLSEKLAPTAASYAEAAKARKESSNTEVAATL